MVTTLTPEERNQAAEEQAEVDPTVAHAAPGETDACNSTAEADPTVAHAAHGEADASDVLKHAH